MLFETFENRRLMAVTALHYHGALQVWGDSGNNGISVEKSGTNLLVKNYVSGSGYVTIYTAPDSEVSKIFVQGYAGMDTISISNNVTDRAEIHGGAGADWIKGGGAQNDIYGHGNASVAGSDAASDDSAADTLIGGTGYNNLNGQKGNDVLMSQMDASTSDSNYDMLLGGDGNDTIYLNGKGSSISYAFGQNGVDTFYVQSANQKAYIYGGASYDTVDYADFGQSVYVKPDGTTASGPRTSSANRKQVISTDTEVVKGTNFDDYFSGSEGDNVFYGRNGVDNMHGNGGADLMFGGEGNDSLYGGAGNDNLNGENGNDVISGEGNNDLVAGGNGNDEIHGGSGNDSLYGNADSDWIYGDAGSDLLVGGTGADFLDSHDGVVANDVLYGDNQDGTGAGSGVWDVAYIDRIGTPSVIRDFLNGIETSSY